MAGLVEEIQTAAISPQSSITELLRRVKLAAVKLQLPDALEWVTHELHGYSGVADENMPTYRRFHGRVMEYNPFSGTQPVVGNQKMISLMSYVILRDPVSSIEDLARKEGTVSIDIDRDVARLLEQHEDTAERSFHVKFGTSTLVAILDRVRNLTLDWAIALEQQGIVGGGITFTNAEREKAAAAGMTINIENLTGGFHQANVNGNQNKTLVSSSDQSMTNGSTVFNDLAGSIHSQVADAGDRQAMLALVEQLQASKAHRSSSCLSPSSWNMQPTTRLCSALSYPP